MPLSPNAAARKDTTAVFAVEMQHRHFKAIAAIIAAMDSDVRLAIAKHFAKHLRATNPRFDEMRFYHACNVIVLAARNV